MQPIGLILASVVLGVVGQLALKAGMARAGPLSLGDASILGLAWRIFGRPAVWVGLSLYGVGTLFWIVALSQVELGYAYPFLSLSYVLVLLTGWALFREEIPPLRLLGVAAVCFGIYVIAGTS